MEAPGSAVLTLGGLFLTALLAGYRGVFLIGLAGYVLAESVRRLVELA